MPKDDFTDDVGKWLPDEGEHDLEVVKMEEGESKAGNPKYTISFASAIEPQNGIIQDLTNIPGKRWLLRQLIEACGIEPEINEESRKIYNWEISDIEGKTITANIVHDKTPFVDRNGNEKIVPKTKVVAFKKLKV
jgi:hypothetical protein